MHKRIAARRQQIMVKKNQEAVNRINKLMTELVKLAEGEKNG